MYIYIYISLWGAWKQACINGHQFRLEENSDYIGLPRSTGKPEEGRAEDEPQVPCGLDQQALPPLLPLPMQRPSCIKPDSDKWHGVTPQCLSVQ